MMMMTIVTRRLGDRERKRTTAEAGEEYIRKQLVKDRVEEVGKEEARKVIADSIMNAHEINNLGINKEKSWKFKKKKASPTYLKIQANKQLNP